MRNIGCSLLRVSVLCLVPCLAHAQAPPKVLLIQREYVKPGRAGEAHEKSESAFVQAMAKAKWPVNYLALTSLSGKSRALFFTFYPSFEAWEQDAAASGKNASLSASLEKASSADGELLESSDQAMFVYEEQFSLRPKYQDPKRRALEISSYHVRPGHYGEWIEIVKLVRNAYEKNVPDAHWACYRLQYGGQGGTYLVLTGLKSASEIDAGFERGKQFESALGEHGLRRLEELESSAVDSAEHQLFVFNPRMSYPSDDLIKGDPEFWQPPKTETKTVAAKNEKP
jgi:hypothetical protein